MRKLNHVLPSVRKENEKSQLHNFEIDQVIEIIYKICKEIFKD